MRFLLYSVLSILLVNCASRKAIQRVVVAHNHTFPLQQLTANVTDSARPSDIRIKNIQGLPAQTEVIRTGILILPLLFYNHFQANYQVLLGQDVLDEQWSIYVDKRLKAFASDLERNGINHVQLEMKKAVAHGKYTSGHAYLVTPSYYYNAVQDINLSRSKDASAEVAITLSWTDNAGNEESRDASVKIQVARNGVYSGLVRTLLGKTISLSQHDINFNFDHNIQSRPPYIGSEPMLTVHLFRLSDLLVLGLDELCQTIIMETKGEEVKPLPPSYAASLLQARNLLWEKLKSNKLGTRFNRGYSNSGGFRSGVFYDFVSNKAHLTVDVGTDRQKFPVEQYLFSMGQNTSHYQHLYFRSEEVIKNIDEVIAEIRREMNSK